MRTVSGLLPTPEIIWHFRSHRLCLWHYVEWQPLWINWEENSKLASFCIGKVSTVWWPLRNMLLADGSWSVYNSTHFRLCFSLPVPVFFPSGLPLPLCNSSKDPSASAGAGESQMALRSCVGVSVLYVSASAPTQSRRNRSGYWHWQRHVIHGRHFTFYRHIIDVLSLWGLWQRLYIKNILTITLTATSKYLNRTLTLR